jgi:chaperonin cofactor prefoldin
MFKKKKEKELNFKLKIIEKIGTLETQNQFLFERVQRLEEELQKHIQGGN